MQLPLLCTAIAVVVISEQLPTTALPAAGDALAGIAAVNIVLLALILWVGARFAKSLRHPTQKAARRFRRWRVVRTVAWFSTTLATSLLFHWPRIVRSNAGLDQLVLLDELLILLPAVLPAMVIWWADERVFEVVTDNEVNSRDRLRQVMAQARHHLLLCVAPVLILTLVEDICAKFGGGEANVPVAIATTTIVLLGLYPLIVRLAWNTRPLPEGPLKDRLQRIARENRIRIGRIDVWETGGQVANAAVAGYTPWLRTLILSDRLLKEFPPELVEAIWRHEAAHIARRHLALRVAILCMPWCLYLLLQHALPNVHEWLTSIPAGLGLPSTLFQSLLVPAVIVAATAIALGRVSRLCEFDADQWSCRMGDTVKVARHRDELLNALQQLAQSERLPDRRGWLHPSINSRLARLRELDLRPETKTEVDLAVRRNWRGIAAIVVATLISVALSGA